MKKVSTILALCALVFASTVLAQQESEEKDFLEVTVAGGMAIPSGGISDWNDSLGAKTGWLLGFEAGYFVKPNIVVGLAMDYSQHSIDTETRAKELHHRIYSPALYGKYYFMGESNFIPYVKAQIGLDFVKFTTDVTDHNIGEDRFRELSYDPSFAFGAGVGAFYYTSDYSGLFVEADYRTAGTKSTTGTYQDTEYTFGESTGIISLRAGIHVFFSKGE